MRRSMVAVLGAALAATMLVAAPGSAAAPGSSAASSCAVRWGSLEKTVDVGSTGRLADVRSGRHTCFDRLVLDVAGDVEGYRVAYERDAAQEGTGTVVPLRGGAVLAVSAHVPAYDDDGRSTYLPRDAHEVVDVDGYRTLRQVAWLGSYEGRTSLGVGVRARLPFRTFVLDGPGTGSRLVVDVAHRW